MQIKAFFQKTTLLTVVIFGLLLGGFVYALIDKTVFVPQQLIIIPDTVTSDTWSNLGNSLINDISGESLYQDFSSQNSAYIDQLSLVTIPEIEVNETDVPIEEETGASIDAVDSDEAFLDESVSQEPAVAEEPLVDSIEESLPAPKPANELQSTEGSEVEPQPVIEEVAEVTASAQWGVAPRGVKLFPLAQEVITTEVESEVVTESPAIEEDPFYNPEAQVPSELIEPKTESVVEPEPELVVDNLEVETPTVDPDINIGDETTNSAEETLIYDEEVAFNIEDDCLGDSECKLYSVTFTGFTMPEFESGTFLTAAQLRLSLAASTKYQDREKLQRFVVEYTYEEGAPWQTATIIDIGDEISNSINGGYFLVSLERPLNQNQLSNLQVRLSYQGDISQLERAYIESVWLEVTSGKFFEKGAGSPYTDAVTYGRDLLAPQFHVLNDSELDPTLGQLPTFTLSYDPQQGFFNRIFHELFSENTFVVESIDMTDSSGEQISIPFSIEYHADETWTMRAQQMPQKLRPGKYLVTVNILENDVRYTDTFEFYWGVIAVNTKKSMYFPNEEVILNLAALTDKGETICNANLQLKITDPKGFITEVPVEQTGACGPNNVTDIPDYVARFTDTDEWGKYTIQLQHKNASGEVIHRIADSFEVRDYIPFDIERTAPTRIFPPAPYDVTIKIKAYRDFTGDINERVPRGFIVEGLEGALISTLPQYTLITWPNVTMRAGEELTLSYNFDAPDITPYMYLLGPLDMDGFAELRQWQVASDALNNIGWFTGTRTVAGTNLNNAPSPMQWSSSSIDNYYYTHSTTSNSQRVTLRQSGDYLLSVNLPQQRSDVNVSRTRGAIEVRKNGVAVPEGLGRSGYITGGSGAVHSESSSNVSFLLTDVNPNDYVEVFVENLSTIDAGDTLVVSGLAAMYLEYLGPTETVFAATTTRTTNSVNLNQATAFPLEWIETRQDVGFLHSNTVTPQNIIITATGTYMVHINVPITGVGHTVQQNIAGRVLLDGVVVSGGHFQQGYIEPATIESDGDSSIHWSGVVVTTTTNQVLTVTTAQEAGAGTTTVPTGFVGSIVVQKLPTSGVIALRGRDLVGGTNWNPTNASSTRFNTQLAYDSTTFTHSTTTNNHQITVNQSGDYILNFTGAVTSAVTNVNNRITVAVNGVPVTGARSKSNFIRNLNAHNQGSTNLVFLLEGIIAGQIITVNTQQEAVAGVVSTTTDAMLMLWKKADLNFRAPAPTMFNTPFDNVRFASTTPHFDFQSNDPDGSSDVQYEFSISTTSNFASAIVRVSGTHAGFSNTASTTDTSPFVENNRVRFQLQPADALSDLTTYYWRVRARDVSGSGEFGDYSTTQSLTINAADTVPNWYQTLSGQFSTNLLVGAVSAGSQNNVQVDASISSEILIGYGDGTNTTPRYRLWNGTAWGVEQSALSVSGAINWVRTEAAVNRDEYIMVTLDAASDAFAQVYNGTTNTWGNQTLLSNSVSNNTRKGIAVGYESVSGDAMVVSCHTGASPVYRIWNGSSWTATTSIAVTSATACNYLEIASDPASDELILVIRGAGDAYQALVWNGNAWVANQTLGAIQVGNEGRAGIGVIYESSGDQAIIAVTNGTGNNIIYTTWSGTAFTPNTTQPIGNDFEFAGIAADPASDNIALCYIDDDADIGVLRWNGGVWSTFFELETSGNSQAGRPVDCEFETVAGRAGNIMAVYSDTVAARHRVFNYSSTSWTAEQSITGIGTAGLFWGQTERAADGIIVSVWHDDSVAGDEIESSYWNGTSWSTKQSIVPNPSSILGTPYETFEMAAKRFQFSEGIVRSTPITFNHVPNQPTWGDLSFGSTEPFGTDVVVRLRYTSTTTCDVYIPNSSLPGNTAGFTSDLLPVVLSGLSTTTFSQICLEATLTTFGSASASLDEWSVSWQRKPRLVQNAYRWYSNGSFFTPTDPWPAGVIDVGENSPLSSTESVNINDVIRLRLALEGANVTLATNTAAFKLQYAQGLSCNLLTNWTDVAPASSSTALWRGYANSIVGTDWYNAAWGRRIGISVNSSQVPANQTDFPVYVNLDDLPDAFFSGVQSDGDDIRVTQSDGVTEVPFELVSINTVARNGELHFRASLSSTTSSQYYIYYGNASASGYAASATFGSRNVWTNNYAAVYHLNQDPTGTGAIILDSTANNRHGTRVGTAGAGRLVAAQIGNGLDFVGTTGDYTIDFPSFGIAGNSSYTYSAWFRASTTVNGGASDGDGTYMVDRTVATNELVGLKVIGGNYAHQFRYNDGTGLGAISGGAAGAASWRHVTWGRAYNSNRFITVDNVRATTTDNASFLTPPLMRLGGHQGNTSFTGVADEIRISSVARSSTWTATEFNNQSNPTGFYTVSAEQLIHDGRPLPTTILTGSDFAETYEENNPTGFNRFALPVASSSEWDFVLQNNAALPNTNYCFRMVYADGSTLNTYAEYPRLITNAPPLAPILTAPFDNEQHASTTPWFEFSAEDEVSDLVSYEIMVDTDYNFGSPDITSESQANFALFTNIAAPSERGIYTSGQTIRFVPSSALVNGNTYWWRVRAKDDNGSGVYGEWSIPRSFTINTATVITTWFQTTGDQFSTNSLIDAVSSISTNDVGIEPSFTTATMTTSVIDFDDRDVGNAWGSLGFTQNVTTGTIRHRVEYEVTAGVFALVPDSLIPGNSAGLTSSPVSLASLDTTVHNVLRVTSTLTGNATLPRLQSMTIVWSKTIDVPTLVTTFDNAKVATTTPTFTFFTTDPQSDSLEYEFQYSSDSDFMSSTTFRSGSNPGFVNTASSSDLTPFTSGETVRYTLQSALTNGNTYWWRVRARDPLGSNTWSSYSAVRSFTVDTSILVSAWHQTTGDQFDTNANQDIETTAGGAQVTSLVSGVMSAYGEGTGQAPQYRLWNGTSWSAAASANTVGAQIRWIRLDAAPTRLEYALATLGTDLDINIQIFDGVSEAWGNLYEIYDSATEATKRRFDIEYETVSGNLLAVACEGNNARFSIWNGSSWSATSSIPLAAGTDCEWVTMSADPASNEIIAMFRHTNTAATDYQALVWNGSSWGNSITFGNLQENAHEAMSLNYEASGNQAIAVASNNLLGSFLWSAWNGTSWTTATATAIANDFEWGSLKRDVGSDNMVMCYIDDAADIGVIRWNGSAWSTANVMTALGNSKASLPADCEFQTLMGTDGDFVVPYSDTTDAKYQTFETATGTYSGELSLIVGTNINDSFRMHTVRGGDGMIHLFAFDDGSAPDRYDTSRWNGTIWSARENFSTNPSITTTPFDGSITAAAQIYPNFTSGTIMSTAINFADGFGPRWERFLWNDTTPGASDIRYRLYYQTSTSTFALVPDSALAGNAVGFTASPVSIAGLDRTVYPVLKMEAELICNSGTCPTIQDWSLEWSQGINVSGTAFEYNGTTTVTTGTVAVAVNGILQAGKTANIGGGGNWIIPNVTTFPGDAITVFIDGANDSDEAIAITTYDGVGDVTQMELNKRHVTFGSTDVSTTTNSQFGSFDISDDEDVFFAVTGGSTLNICAEAACADAVLKIKSSAAYQPGANITIHDLNNQGQFLPDSTTVRVSGSWLNTGTFTPSLSTIIFTATTSSETITSTSSATTTVFHNVTFGETNGTASWSVSRPLDITGSLAVDWGTFVRSTSTINLEQNFRIGAGGFISGIGTTTFDGTGSHTWTDLSTSSTNIGRVVVDGIAKTITLGGNVAAQTVTIGADDTLNASGSGFNINVVSNWINNNSFIPQSGTVTFTGTTTGTIARGTSPFNNLTFSGVGGNWSFSTSTLVINNNLTIATGTVTLPTGTTTIGGNFNNSGGTFLHNNGEVRMTSATGGRTITQRATTFLNAFFDLTFAGSGAWSYSESAATTTRHYRIQSGTVTMPSGTKTIGGDFNVTGSGAFTHNNGEVILLVQDSNTVRTNGSSFNNLRTRGGSGSWYSSSWSTRKAVSINSNQVGTTVTDFPVYVNLANLGADFFSTVRADGGDIRVTTGDGMTEVPIEVVTINTSTQTGELHFRAPTLSTSTNSLFYIYYGNSAAVGYASTTVFGSRNVWTNGFVGVYHLNQDPTGTGAIILDSTANSRHGTRVGTAAPGRLVAAQIGQGLDMVGTSGDYVIEFPSPGLSGTSSFTMSAWFRTGATTDGLATDGAGTYMADRTTATNELVGLKVIGGNYAHQHRYNDGSGLGAVIGSAVTGSAWQFVTWGRTYNVNRFISTNGIFATTGDNASALTLPNQRLGGHQSNTIYAGLVDEFRISSVARSSGWVTTEFNNQASTTAFYTTGAAESRFSRTFTDTNVTILGNFILDTGGGAIFPTGVLSVAGSFDNNATFNHSSGTVRFNATSGARTIAAGTSSNFATLEFNSASGDFTVTENATATMAVNLTNAAQFTLQSGLTLATLGTFNNAANGLNTTWSGSTLSLSGPDGAINLKTHGGDTYGTILTNGDTDMTMWNSTATSFTTASTSSIYSADHAGVDGDLNIYGDYVRTTGTEFWSFATDFDGTALTGITSRQVDVRVASSSRVGFTSASLNIVGQPGASTTIDSQSGAFALNATNTTITAEHFRVAGTGASGFGLLASTTLSVFRDGFFTVAPGQTGITFATSTINTNPSAQFFRIGFATTTIGAATNVTLNGTTTNFVWFRDGMGNLYGEAFDGADANPGSIRFDDSSNSIIVSGIVYADDGVTPLGAPTCNGITPNVRVVVNGGTYIASTTCAAGTGAYSFPAVNFVGDPRIVVYLDTNGGAQGSVVTKTPTGNITNMHIYANRVITRHQDIAPLTASDMQMFDFDNDSDLRFIAATTSLTLLPNTELFVFASTTFAPGGNITLTGNGNTNGHEGTLQLGANATFTASGTQTHTLAGRFVMATTSTFTAASSTFIFNATTTGKSITSPNLVTFNQLQFAGTGGGWNITAPLSIQADMHVASGTVTGTGNITLQNGSLYGNGVLSLGAGTTTINRTNTLGGTTAWTFSNLVLGNGAVVGTTTPASSATTTILGTLTIANAHFLAAGNSVFDLAGTGNVLVRTGTLLEDTSTIRFSGATANVPSINYYNLHLNAGAGLGTYTGVGTGILVLNDLVVGGTASSTFNANTNDPVVEVRGDVFIASNSTLQASNSANLTILGDYTNTGSFVGNGGTVRFTGSTTSFINAGLSSFSNVLINGTGSFVIDSHATATNSFVLTNHGAFTVNNGRTLSVGGQFTNTLGGASTNWATSTLLLTGAGTFSINASTTNDVYNNLAVAAGTQIRMWNSSAASYNVNTTGSLYSQDHAGIDGDAYIWGQLIRTTGSDHWSFATDFDGTALLAGAGRQAEIYFASGASATWAGGSLSAIGSPTASTTLQNQGSGTYGLTFGTGATVLFDTVTIRDISSNGVVFAGSPMVTNFSRTDHLVAINSGSAITVGGTVINANEARNFTSNKFEAGGGVINAKSVTATGTAVSSWRFTNHIGNIAGEAFDDDPAGDPGYIVWDDSAALITVSGNVYSDEGVTVSTVCDGTTNNIRLVVAGLTTYNTSCNAVTGAYSIAGVAYSPLDTLTVFINGETPRAATVSASPVSSISNMHLYHNRVIVRHENIDPLTIANMAVWDSSDDPDINFTATTTGTDTLVLPANTKLIIWTSKTFEPNGNVTVLGGGAGAAFDGTLEAQSNARFRARTTETHSVGGSVVFGTGAEFVGASSTLTLTTTGAARTFDVNNAALHNLTMSGSGSYVVSDTTLTLGGSYTQSNGAVTFPTGTTTIGASFNVTSGSFVNSGSHFIFTSTALGNTVRFNNSPVAALSFTRNGTFTMSDTNATSTGSVLITGSTVTLPSGNFAVGGNFEKRLGTVNHNTSDIIMTATSSAVLTASSSDLFAVSFTGPATFTITDPNITFLDSLTIASGSVALATGTTAVGGSFVATGGTFTSASGTVLLNSASGGRTINPGVSSFYNLQFGAPSGGYTLFSATTTNNLTIASANILTVNPGSVVTVGGVFINSVGGTATTWTNTTLNLISQSNYSINTRLNSGDVYGTLSVGANTDVRSWYSSAATTTVNGSGSLYSQDNGNVNGALFVYGDLVLATSTEYWNYSNDFDGTPLSGVNQRAVTVSFAPNATTTVTTGSLQILGASSFQTILQNQGTGTYSIAVTGGTINANHYEVGDMNVFGLRLSNLSTIVDLSNGYFDIAVASGSAITLSSTTLNANPSKIFNNVGFNATGPLTGHNVNLVGETTNAWRFSNNYGNIGGEAFDIDGIDACGSVRFDNSSCLLTSQTQIRWRNNDGGVGVVSNEWFDSSFNYRVRVRVLNNDAQTYSSTSVKVLIPYDSSMQADFRDLRFTSGDGLTTIPFWVERFTASTEALVWVRVPTLPASDYATVFMYYGSSTATSLSSGSATFNAFDDFEDNNITEYSGDTSLFQTDTTPVYGGSFALEAVNKSGRTTDGIFRTAMTVSQGQVIRWMQYLDAAGPGDDACTLFGVQSPGASNNNYALCLQKFGVDRMVIARNISDNDSSGTVLASSTATFVTGWYEVEIDWRTNNSINATLRTATGTLVATASTTDATYTTGGIGFTFWFQNGSWDSFTSRARVGTAPTIFLGAEQTAGGASWASALNGSASAIPGDVRRLRVAIENSGLNVTAQQYRLEFAAKGAAPTCESVSGSSYAVVPNQASCGTSPICMQASTFVANGDPTTDLLFGTKGTFRAGSIVESPSSQTSAIDLNQNFYTELEYVITPTSNAADSYCFRVTNNGTPLDYYAKIAELGLRFDPTFGAVTLNGGADISLTPGTTTPVVVFGTITDFNGGADIAHATATIYRSGAGPSCTQNNNNCYVATTENGQCTLINCAGNSCDLSCEVDMIFHADATDNNPYLGENWLAYAEAEDFSGGYDFASAIGVELLTLRALAVDSFINYGALAGDSDTGSFNPTTTITNLGNTPINVDVTGTDLSDGVASAIPASQQKMATSTFTYNACVACQRLSSSTPVTLGLNLSKPSMETPPVETDVFWGIAVPFTASNAAHTGTNIFTAIGVD